MLAGRCGRQAFRVWCALAVIFVFIFTVASANPCASLPPDCMRGTSKCPDVRGCPDNVPNCEPDCNCVQASVLGGYRCESPPLNMSSIVTPPPDQCLGTLAPCSYPNDFGREGCSCLGGCEDGLQCNVVIDACYRCVPGYDGCGCRTDGGTQCEPGLACQAGVCRPAGIVGAQGTDGGPCYENAEDAHKCHLGLYCGVGGTCQQCVIGQGQVGCACSHVNNVPCAGSLMCDWTKELCLPCPSVCSSCPLAGNYDPCSKRTCTGCRTEPGCKFCNQLTDQECITEDKSCPTGMEPDDDLVCGEYSCTDGCGGGSAGKCSAPGKCECFVGFVESGGSCISDTLDKIRTGAIVGGCVLGVLIIVTVGYVYRTKVGELWRASKSGVKKIGSIGSGSGGGGGGSSSSGSAFGKSGMAGAVTGDTLVYLDDAPAPPKPAPKSRPSAPGPGSARGSSNPSLRNGGGGGGDGGGPANFPEPNILYHNVARLKAVAMLQDCVPGAYMVRPSSKPGAWSLSFKDGSNMQVTHVVLLQTPSGWRKENSTQLFPTCFGLLSELSQQLSVDLSGASNSQRVSSMMPSPDNRPFPQGFAQQPGPMSPARTPSSFQLGGPQQFGGGYW